MADNITLNAGAGGDVIAADALGGSVKHQQVLAEFGAAGTATRVDATHGMPVTPAQSASATCANVASSAGNVTLLASNTSRGGAVIVNDSTQWLYIKFGATASLTSYSYPIAPGQVWEMPAWPKIYTGIIDGIWAAANGNARTTEW